MKSFGELIRDARKRAGLTQREVAARIMLDEGRSMSSPYLNDIEHNLRKPPRNSIIKQFAKVLGLEADLLYFAARRLPDDIPYAEVSDKQIIAAFRAFRKELKKQSVKSERNALHAARKQRADFTRR